MRSSFSVVDSFFFINASFAILTALSEVYGEPQLYKSSSLDSKSFLLEIISSSSNFPATMSYIKASYLFLKL